MIKRVAIIGVGLIGSSLGLALGDIKEVEEVIGIDKNQDYLKEALDIGAIDRIATLEEGVRDVDLIIIATPVGIIKDLVVEILPYISNETIITDVGSTKSTIVRELEGLVGDHIYIGGHPMTGAETSGPSGADKYLFENAIYVLTETKNTDQDSLEKLKNILERIGSQVLILSPESHDRMVAVTSHLPHLIAVNLMSVIEQFSQEDDKVTSLIAGGFRDTTRIAAGDPVMWRDIFLNNREMVLETINIFEERLASLKELILKEERESLEQTLAEIRDARIRLPMKKKGLLPSNFELIITLKDEPNAIGRVASLLGDAEINIQDIEVLKVRDEGGTIRLSFSQEEKQEKAYRLLKENNYKVIKK
jgi:prephenate dehydrogenase